MTFYDKGGRHMTMGKQNGYDERVEDLVSLAKSGKGGQIEVNLSKEIVKQTTHTEETDDLKEEKDLYLLIGYFKMLDAREKHHEVTKVYAIGNINDTEIEEKIIRNIANERLKMDYRRLQDIEHVEIDYQKLRFF
jgi:hypothetical protein